MLFALVLVWVADIGAYFGGRRFGRVQLAPQVSPGKTWEGVLGAVLLSALVAIAGALWFHLPLGTFLALCLAVVGFSIVGDLTESLLKRFAGVKDSGTLFPGHGGVMDRIDSITGAAPVLFLGLTLPWGSAMMASPYWAPPARSARARSMCSRAIRSASGWWRSRRTRNAAKLARQVLAFRPPYAALADATAARGTHARYWAARRPEPACSPAPAALEEIARLPEVHCVMAAIVGAAGLRSTLAAARAGKRLLLANKESLVMAGPAAARRGQALRRHAAADRQRAQRHLPVPAARARAAGVAPPGLQAHAAHRLRRPVPRHAARGARDASPPRPPARIRTGSWAARSRWTRPRS